jgi:hypothetical protein
MWVLSSLELLINMAIYMKRSFVCEKHSTYKIFIFMNFI